MEVLEAIIEKDISLQQQRDAHHQRVCAKRNARLNSVSDSLHV